ncbi:MAG TPA: hypothetical protein VGN26_04135 [Armatimonadota bacterium]|jgi:hypothetical protein
MDRQWRTLTDTQAWEVARQMDPQNRDLETYQQIVLRLALRETLSDVDTQRDTIVALEGEVARLREMVAGADRFWCGEVRIWGTLAGRWWCSEGPFEEEPGSFPTLDEAWDAAKAALKEAAE